MQLLQWKNDNLMLWDEQQPITREDIVGKTVDYIAVKKEGCRLYSKMALMTYFLEHQKTKALLTEVEPLSDVAVLFGRESVFDVISILKRYQIVLVLDDRGLPGFVLENTELLADITLARFRWAFYDKIFNDIEEEIFVTDRNGKVLYMNPQSEKICGVGRDDCIGRNVQELQKRGIFSESITLEVIAKDEKVEKIVEVASGRHIISTAIPLYTGDADGGKRLEYVLCTSKDINAINELVQENESIARELDDSKKELVALRQRVISQKNYVFESPAMKEIRKTIMRIAPTDVTVLVDGETGAGKEVAADLIHSLSNRSGSPLMKVNCGLIPSELLESELFGYMPGAFSGALKEGKIGVIEAGNKGTIFLDEIGEMPLLLQVKLLEFLQDRKIQRLGGVKKIPIDVRVVAATNRDLKEMVEQGNFRKDLYYRLNVMPIHLPPLRERKEDIQPLAKLFLQKFNHQYHFHKRFAEEVLQGLVQYDWPGNVRELMHVVERFAVSAEEDVIGEGLLREVLEKPILSNRIICTEILPLMEAREELDRILVTTAMDRFGSTRKAAETLGVNQSTVVRLLNKFKDQMP